jgi:drug/metabolite transporter (DMT)-like permease
VNRAFLYVFLLACCWAPSYLCIKIAMEDGITPLTITAIRCAGGAILLYGIMRTQGQRLRIDRKMLPHLAFLGLFNCCVPWMLFSFAQYHVTSALTSVMNGAVPILTAVAAHFALHNEPLTRRKGLGVFLGFTAFGIFIAPTLMDGKLEGDTIGLLAVLAACCSCGTSMIYTRKYLHGVPMLVAPVGQLLFATAYLVPAWLLFEGPGTGHFTVNSAAAIGYMTIFGSGIAFFLFFRIVDLAGATAVATVGYLIPIIGTSLGLFVKGEVLSPSAWFAFFLILCGMVLINREASRLKAAEQASD